MSTDSNVRESAAERDLAAHVKSEHVTTPDNPPDATIAKLRAGLGGMVRTLARVVEVRDPFKTDHHRIVSNLSRAIADEMGCTREQVEGIRLAASIHDLGKIYVPVEVLTKPGKISDAEFNLIKAHPGIAYNILSEAKVPFSVGTIVLQHHERVDGSGYPYGLVGDKICLEARILAVADVIEAMLSARPYRPARTLADATKEVHSQTDKLFDRQVAEACLDLFTSRQLDDFR